MVFGQSGGGAKIATMMGLPAARGLLLRAATMSGQQVTATGPLHATARPRSEERRVRKGRVRTRSSRRSPYLLTKNYYYLSTHSVFTPSLVICTIYTIPHAT